MHHCRNTRKKLETEIYDEVQKANWVKPLSCLEVRIVRHNRGSSWCRRNTSDWEEALSLQTQIPPSQLALHELYRESADNTWEHVAFMRLSTTGDRDIMSSGHLSIRLAICCLAIHCLSTNGFLRDAISLHLVERFQWNSLQIFTSQVVESIY